MNHNEPNSQRLIINRLELYKKILEIRQKLKAVQQVSWNISKMEQRYPLETLFEDEFEEALKFYLETVDIVLNEILPPLQGLRKKSDEN